MEYSRSYGREAITPCAACRFTPRFWTPLKTRPMRVATTFFSAPLVKRVCHAACFARKWTLVEKSARSVSGGVLQRYDGDDCDTLAGGAWSPRAPRCERHRLRRCNR